MTTPSRLGAAFAMLLLGGVTLGFVPVLVRLTDTGPAAAGFWRMLMAMPVLALLAARSGAGGGGATAPSRAALLAGLLFGLDLATWHYGLHFTSVANATVLGNLAPVVVTAVAWLVFRQRPRPLFLAALALAVGGMWLMAMARGGGGKGANPPLGDLISVGAAVWYAFYMMAMERARRGLSASRAMFWSSLVSTPVLLVAALALRETLLPGALSGWAACAGLALAHVVGQGAVAWALGRLPASTGSVVLLIQPVVTGVLGWLMLSEALTGLQIAAGAAVLAGIVLAQRAARPPNRPSRAG